jgi:hypothetical protein
VRLDTEGQYELVAATIADYLLVEGPEESFDQNHEQLMALGLSVSASHDQARGRLDPFAADNPSGYRHERYNEQRVTRGLSPI